jgi:hypothetical protein
MDLKHANDSPLFSRLTKSPMHLIFFKPLVITYLVFFFFFFSIFNFFCEVEKVEIIQWRKRKRKRKTQFDYAKYESKRK